MQPSWKILFIICIAALLAMLGISGVFAASPTGGSPLDPLMVPTDWSNIAPNTTVWFYFDYGVGAGGQGEPGGGPRPGSSSAKSTVNVTVETNGVSGLQFAVYTPDQGKDWLRDQSIAPVGRGAPYKDTASGNITRDLYWSGAFNSSGRYFVAVSNTTSSPISLHLTVTGDTVTLYPAPTPTATPTIPALVAATPVPAATIQGKIVFETATGGMIYTVNGDGSNLRQLTNGIDPTWSPDGKQIAFARWGSIFPGLYVINADGSNEHLAYGASRIRSPRWSSDGKYIAFTQEKTSGKDAKWKLGVIELNKAIDADTTKNVLTEPQCASLCYAPSWSSDSAALYYTDPDTGIMATSIISGSAQVIKGPSGTYFDTQANIARPILHMTQIQSTETSPDGNRIVYSQQAHDRWEINISTSDGKTSTAITSPDLVLYTLWGVTVHNVAPTWSPDSKQVLFLSNRNSKWEFFVVNADGSNVRQVLKNVTDQITLQFDYQNERMASWSK